MPDELVTVETYPNEFEANLAGSVPPSRRRLAGKWRAAPCRLPSP